MSELPNTQNSVLFPLSLPAAVADSAEAKVAIAI